MQAESKAKRISILANMQDLIFMKHADMITTVSKKDYNIVKNNVKIDESKICFIPNGINNLEENKLFSLNKKNDYILFAAARIFESKGCHLFLKALINLNYEGTVLIIGQLDDKNEYNDNILNDSRKLKDVRFLGLIKEKELLYEYIYHAKLFIYPSYIESMSMMMLEVASLKTPMICADISENKDLFTEEEVLFSKAMDSEDLSNKIMWSLSNYNKMENMALNAFIRLKKEYLWSDIAKKYDECYQKL